jgi:hypothetical protein
MSKGYSPKAGGMREKQPLAVAGMLGPLGAAPVELKQRCSRHPHPGPLLRERENLGVERRLNQYSGELRVAYNLGN